jgi:DNA primase
MFPIRNGKGELVGFGGRIIGKGEPKYLNSPETPVFSKGQELYGLFEAKAAIRKEACVIVVEGYMDVVGLAQLGVANAVATLGTATTPVHIQKLLRSSDRIIFSFDGDKAGRRAAWRALQTCLPLLRDDISIRFLFLPEEHDPDSYIRQFGAEAFRACMSESDALSTFFLNELADRYPLKEAEGRSRLVFEAKPLLAQIPQSALKVQLQNELARLVQLTPEELSTLVAKAPATDDQPAQTGSVGHDEPDVTVRGSPTGSVETGRSNFRKPVFARSTRRSVTPLALRLLSLLLAHPALAQDMGDQQLDVLEQGESLDMVLDLIILIQKTHAKHVGALIQGAESGSDLEALLMSVSADVMAQEELPDPESEWEDALRRIEIENLKREQSELIASDKNNLQLSQKYQELSRRIGRLISVSSQSKAR